MDGQDRKRKSRYPDGRVNSLCRHGPEAPQISKSTPVFQTAPVCLAMISAISSWTSVAPPIEQLSHYPVGDIRGAFIFCALVAIIHQRFACVDRMRRPWRLDHSVAIEHKRAAWPEGDFFIHIRGVPYDPERIALLGEKLEQSFRWIAGRFEEERPPKNIPRFPL